MDRRKFILSAAAAALAPIMPSAASGKRYYEVTLGPRDILFFESEDFEFTPKDVAEHVRMVMTTNEDGSLTVEWLDNDDL